MRGKGGTMDRENEMSGIEAMSSEKESREVIYGTYGAAEKNR